MGRLFWKTCAGTARSLRCIGRLQHSVLIKNGRSWRKHLSMSVSRGRSSKDTLPFATPRHAGRWQPLRKAVKGNKVKLSPNKTGAIVRGFQVVTLIRPIRNGHADVGRHDVSYASQFGLNCRPAQVLRWGQDRFGQAGRICSNDVDERPPHPDL